MSYRNLDELVSVCEKKQPMKKFAVVCAQDEHTLEAIELAFEKKVAVPILIGDKEKILQKLEGFPTLKSCEIIAAVSDEDAAQKAIDLVKEGKADVISKGLLETATLMKSVIKKENNICPSGIMSHITIFEIPNYKKIIGLTDAAVLTYPDLEKKKQLIINAVNYMKSLTDGPVKVAVLAAVEVVNPKMQETVEARQLQEMADAGEIKDCIVEGPISYDLAMRKDAAEVKGYKSRIAGDPDLLVVPNIQVGNVLAKALTVSADAMAAGLLLGASVPIVITSRSSTVDTKYKSLVLAASV